MSDDFNCNCIYGRCEEIKRLTAEGAGKDAVIEIARKIIATEVGDPMAGTKHLYDAFYKALTVLECDSGSQNP